MRSRDIYIILLVISLAIIIMVLVNIKSGKDNNDEYQGGIATECASDCKTSKLEKITSVKPETTNRLDSDNQTVTDGKSSKTERKDDNTIADVIGYKAVNNSKEGVASNAVVCSSNSELSKAIKNAKAGDIIYMKGGNYTNYSLEIQAAGSTSKYIVIKSYPGEKAIFTNCTIEFQSSARYIRFEDFIIKDYTPNEDWGTCVSFCGGTSYIEFRNNEISNIKCKVGKDVGVNPLVLYGDSSSSINNILIENCYIHDCDTGRSEALTTNGNVEQCIIKNCTIDNTNNIGIDLAGNFSWTGKVGEKTNQSRNILVTRNLIKNCNSPYATSAGLYCDGGRENTFSYNIIYNSQCGIELGAEEPGADVHDFTIEHNTIVNCGRAIGAGAYLDTGAKHYNTTVNDNIIVCNKANKWGDNTAILLERTKNFVFKNNKVYLKNKATEFIQSNKEATYTLEGNMWYVDGGKGSKPSQDKSGKFVNPKIEKIDDMLNGRFN